jgi:hypothetical protein
VGKYILFILFHIVFYLDREHRQSLA